MRSHGFTQDQISHVTRILQDALLREACIGVSDNGKMFPYQELLEGITPGAAEWTESTCNQWYREINDWCVLIHPAEIRHHASFTIHVWLKQYGIIEKPGLKVICTLPCKTMTDYDNVTLSQAKALADKLAQA